MDAVKNDLSNFPEVLSKMSISDLSNLFLSYSSLKQTMATKNEMMEKMLSETFNELQRRGVFNK